MEVSSQTALLEGGSLRTREKGRRVQEAKTAFFDDWSKASYLNLGFYSSINSS